MNETLESLYNRKSVRAYEERSIPDECKEAILIAAMSAPTAGNQQLYTIIDITDQDLKDKLAISCDNQPFIAKAPMILIFCADVQKWIDVFKAGGANPRKPGVGDLMLAVQDTTIAAQNAVVAAQSLGIGSCYIGDIMEQCKRHRELLHLPEYVFPACMLVFGYPTKQQLERKKPQRCRLADIVCKNYYTEKNEDQLRRMFDKETVNRSFEQWCQAFCQRKYNSDFSKEMSRSVSEYLKAFSE
ncbi:MAG: nitroreductase family protein [Clostridia bacterium]